MVTRSHALKHNSSEQAPFQSSIRDFANLTGISILYVEDDDDLRTITIKILRRRGAEVLEARSASQALALQQTGRRFDILLTDQDLDDELSGVDLARHFCSICPQLKVVVVSGLVDEVLRGRMDSCWQALQKPVSGDTLVSSLMLFKE